MGEILSESFQVLRNFNDLFGMVWSDDNDRVSQVLPELTQKFPELL